MMKYFNKYTEVIACDEHHGAELFYDKSIHILGCPFCQMIRNAHNVAEQKRRDNDETLEAALALKKALKKLTS